MGRAELALLHIRRSAPRRAAKASHETMTDLSGSARYHGRRGARGAPAPEV